MEVVETEEEAVEDRETTGTRRIGTGRGTAIEIEERTEEEMKRGGGREAGVETEAEGAMEEG